MLDRSADISSKPLFKVIPSATTDSPRRNNNAIEMTGQGGLPCVRAVCIFQQSVKAAKETWTPELIGHQLQQMVHKGVSIGILIAANDVLQVKVQMAGSLGPDDLHIIRLCCSRSKRACA